MRSVSWWVCGVVPLLLGCASVETERATSPQDLNLLAQVSELRRRIAVADEAEASRQRELAARREEIAELHERLERSLQRERAATSRCAREQSLDAAAPAALGTGPFVVQIGAFRNPSADFAARAAEVGTVSTHRTPGGLTVVHVGSFPNKRQASAAQAQLQAQGYADAFVRSASTATSESYADRLPAVGAPPRTAP